MLAPLARDLGVHRRRAAAAVGPRSALGVVLGEAFQAERTLERVVRELAAGTGGTPARGP